MSEHRKPPSVGHYLLFAAIAAILIPVIYFLSLGPVIALAARMEESMPEWVEVAVGAYIFPAEFVYENAGPRIQAAMKSYILFFSE